MLDHTDRWLRRTLLATAITLGGVPSVALAQEAPQTAPPEAPAEGEDVVIPTDAESEEVFSGGEEVIVVTGSIIERRELTTPAPLAVLDKADLDAAGVASIGQILQNLPSQSNAINVQFNNGGDGSTRVSLRGLGAGRTLVLLNGRRHVAGGTGADASVDLNSIPTAIIERVEVLKDGASAVYGSDAIGGVVNIITRSDFEGSEATAYTGITGDGLGQVIDVSAVTGLNSDRGNVVFAAGYTDQQSIGAGDREYSREDTLYDWASGEVTGLGSTAVPEGYIRTYPFEDVPGNEGNAAWEALTGAVPAAANGTRSLFNDPQMSWRRFQTTGNSDVNEGDFYNYQPENYLVTPQKRYSIFSTGSYKLHDHARAFFEATYSNRKSDQRLAPEPLFTATEGITVSKDNYYNPFGRDFVDVRRRMEESGPRRSIQDISTFRVVGGLDGRLPEDLPVLQGWRWNLAFNYGRTESKQIAEGNLVRSRVATALGPSFLDANGTAQCGTPDAPIDGCVPLDVFSGRRTITPEMLEYIQFTGTDSGFNQQQMAQFNLTGKLLEIPGGGDAALAVGAEYRNESGADIPHPLAALGEATGNKRTATEGGYNVSEGFAEVSVVPILGQTGAEWVELNGAVRAFKYDSFDPKTPLTWKAGGLWRIAQGVAVRGTYSTAFRAPTIGALYSGRIDGFPAVKDPCDTTLPGNPPDDDLDGDGSLNDIDNPDDPDDPDNRDPFPRDPRTPYERQNCSAEGLADHADDREQLRSVTGGNRDLQPETAKIFTAGAVYEPTFAPGLAFTLDYFNIDIVNAIQPIGASLQLQSCYNAPPEQRLYCENIQRNDGTQLIETITDVFTNVGGNDTAGVDFNVRYNQNTQVGAFNFSIEGTWLQKYNETLGNGTIREGKGTYNLGVFPDWRFNFGTLWGMNEWGAGANLRYIGAFRECEDGDCLEGTTAEGRPRNDPLADDGLDPIDPLEHTVSAHITGDLFGSYTLETPAGTSRLTLGVNNVLDQTPAVIHNGFTASSDPSAYDFLGRYFYARFVQSF